MVPDQDISSQRALDNGRAMFGYLEDGLVGIEADSTRYAWIS
jgi:hypothetical protein